MEIPKALLTLCLSNEKPAKKPLSFSHVITHQSKSINKTMTTSYHREYLRDEYISLPL